MAHSRKDGRRGGGHKDHQCTEFWSRRCVRVNGARKAKWGKVITHRYERRQSKAIIVEMLNA